jgi:hypothetical protein
MAKVQIYPGKRVGIGEYEANSIEAAVVECGD